jgi:uncharacterized DUF497 family protein
VRLSLLRTVSLTSLSGQGSKLLHFTATVISSTWSLAGSAGWSPTAMPFYFFVWDSENEEHLADHGVSPAEFEEVTRNPDATGESRSTGRPIAFGYTSGGRYLACVFELLDESTVYPITAFEVKD